MKKNKFEFIIDSEFQSQIPALTDEEFQQLEENILSEGEVLSPLIVWGNILVDGHNRYKILQQHPEIPYTTRSISCTCETREDVLAWICKHQLGRRNLTPEQKKFLIGKQYHSEKSTRGGNHGNQYTQVANCQIDNLPSVENTTERIAKENNVSPSFVIRAEQFMKTVELMEKYCPGIQEEILSGKLKLSQREATIIRGTPTEALPTVVSTWREEKLNGKPDDSADTYENLESLSKVTENNFSTAAISKIQTPDPLSENRPSGSSKKRRTELQTIRELGEKMATVDHVADAEGLFSEINSASDSFIFRLEHCFALYPDFLTNVEIEAKVIAALQKAESYIVHLKEQHRSIFWRLPTASKMLSKNLFDEKTLEVNSISDYLTVTTPLPQYLPYARFLLDTDLSHTAKLLYTLLLDRATLSQKNNWVDERGFVYVIFPLSAYCSRKPLIITTNLTLDEIRHPQDTAHARIYDRLLEMCVPISCIGVSFRKENAQKKLKRLKNLIG